MISKEVKYMLAIQRYGSITKAAESLYITQSALSKAVKNIEQQIGTPLFSRIGNDFVPTYAGKRYMAYAEKMAAICIDWDSECADLLGEAKGCLAIAVALMRGSCLIPDTLKRFYAKYPDVQIRLFEEAHSIEKHLLSPEIDFAIYNDTAVYPSETAEILGQEEIVLVMSQNHALVKNGVPKEGCRYSWMNLKITENEKYVLHPPDQTTGKIAANLLKEAAIFPQVLLQTRNSDIAIRLAASGTALCFAPESYVKKIHFDTPPQCFSVGNPSTITTLYGAYQKGRYLPSYGRYFMELVKEYMEHL